MADNIPRVVIVGGGGHATVLVDALRSAGGVTIVGYVAPEAGMLSSLNVDWLGGDDVRELLRARGIQGAVLGIGGLTSNDVRHHACDLWIASGFRFVNVIHPRAVVSSEAVIGIGAQVLAGAAVNAGARLGCHVIVNTNATVEHHCQIGDHVHVAPGATVCGGVVIGSRTLVGAGAVVIPGIRIGGDAMIGAGSVVTRDVPDRAKVIGSPARAMKIPEGTH